MIPLIMFGSRPFLGLTIPAFLLYGALGGLLVLPATRPSPAKARI